jgi:hypothetical protein
LKAAELNQLFSSRPANAAKCRVILGKTCHYAFKVVAGLLLNGLASLVTLAVLVAYTAALFA